MHRPIASAAVLLLCGCTSLVPPLESPALPAPSFFGAPPPATRLVPAAALDWRDYFEDPVLQQLIAQALENNRDLRTAILRVQEAQAALGIQSSARWPTVGGSADATRARTPADLSLTGRPASASQFKVGVGISNWEIDFWGRVGSLESAALESFLATDAAHRAASISLVAGVADAYLGLRELNLRLQLAQDSAASQRESLRISQRRLEVGAASRLELTQVQTLVDQAESLVVQLQYQVDLQRNALRLLLGERGDAPLPTDAGLSWQLPPLQAGLSSDLLLARPDIQAAEHRLRAAHFQIGAARAAFFPSIQLTAFGGTASRDLDGLFQGGSRAWTFTPNLSLPIFDGGRNRANLQLAEVRKHIAVVQYEQVVQLAFREVADALSARRWLAEQARVQQRMLEVQQERARLSRLSHDHGATSFLDVLDAERTLISAAQQLAQTRRSLLSSQVALYRSLGGGALQVTAAPLLPAPAVQQASPSASSPH